MVVYDVFGVADSYTKSQSDTRYPFKGNDSIIRLNGQTISADITIDSDENGVSAARLRRTMPPSLLMDIEHRMTSVLNVDTIADKAGTGPVGLTKQMAPKAWVLTSMAGTLASADSFNVGSVTDNGTGNYTPSATNAMSNTGYAFIWMDESRNNVNPLSDLKTVTIRPHRVQIRCRSAMTMVLIGRPCACSRIMFGNLA